jgi:hypothetical protein
MTASSRGLLEGLLIKRATIRPRLPLELCSLCVWLCLSTRYFSWAKASDKNQFWSMHSA